MKSLSAKIFFRNYFLQALEIFEKYFLLQKILPVKNL